MNGATWKVSCRCGHRMNIRVEKILDVLAGFDIPADVIRNEIDRRRERPSPAEAFRQLSEEFGHLFADPQEETP